MNKKITVLLPLLSTLLLSSCFLINDTKTEEKDIDVFSFVVSEKENAPKEIGKINVKYFSDEEYLPYITLKDYANIVSNFLKDGYNSNFFNYGNYTRWTISNPSKQLVFSSSVNASNKTIEYAGGIANYCWNYPDYSKSSLSVGLTIKPTIISAKSGDYKFDYSGSGYNSFIKRSDPYFPLSLLNEVFSSPTDLYILYNYNRIYVFNDYSQLTDTTFIKNNKEYTVFTEMKETIQNEMNNVMPLYLRKQRLSSFLFIMENLYGLKSTWNVKNMKDYLSAQAFMDDYLSENNATRTEAYYKTIAFLDDGHTAIRDKNHPWSEGTYNSRGEKVTSLVETKATLSEYRKDKPAGSIYYSTDEKLAFFSFDSFTFAMDAYEGESLKEDLKDYSSSNYDSFFYMTDCFNKIVKKGGVTDVVIDISINGGGTLGILMKLLALISKNNSADLYFRVDYTDVIEQDNVKCDSNLDGEYDENDCFGDDFNIILLTSTYSFSCGNAFPFYAKKNNLAKTIGVTSGGGECVVKEAYLASGEHLYHSDLTHIGWYNSVNKTFEGDEAGVTPDKVIAFSDYYDLDYLQSQISSL